MKLYVYYVTQKMFPDPDGAAIVNLFHDYDIILSRYVPRKRYVEKIEMTVSGWVAYTKPLTDEQISEWELIPGDVIEESESKNAVV